MLPTATDASFAAMFQCGKHTVADAPRGACVLCLNFATWPCIALMQCPRTTVCRRGAKIGTPPSVSNPETGGTDRRNPRCRTLRQPRVHAATFDV
jgi:hypothetical protein